jgi:cell division inhibitor SepF
MSSLFSKALVYLGLVDEDHGPAEEEQERPLPEPSTNRGSNKGPPRRIDPLSQVAGRRVEPPFVMARSNVARSQATSYDPAGPMRPLRAVEAQSDILVVEEFADAKILADRVRDRVPVVLELRKADPDLVRRVIDFASGLIYALEGTMTRIGNGVVLVLPPRVTLSDDEKRRLSRLGVYDLSEDQ